MKTTGIVLVVMGILSVLNAIIRLSSGYEGNFAGLALVALGAFLIIQGKKKKEEKEKKKQWEEGNIEYSNEIKQEDSSNDNISKGN